MSRKFLIAGNWKMNKTASEAVDLIEEIKSSVGGSDRCPGVCLSTVHLSLAQVI